MNMDSDISEYLYLFFFLCSKWGIGIPFKIPYMIFVCNSNILIVYFQVGSFTNTFNHTETWEVHVNWRSRNIMSWFYHQARVLSHSSFLINCLCSGLLVWFRYLFFDRVTVIICSSPNLLSFELYVRSSKSTEHASTLCIFSVLSRWIQ